MRARALRWGVLWRKFQRNSTFSSTTDQNSPWILSEWRVTRGQSAALAGVAPAARKSCSLGYPHIAGTHT